MFDYVVVQNLDLLFRKLDPFGVKSVIKACFWLMLCRIELVMCTIAGLSYCGVLASRNLYIHIIYDM